MNSDDIVVDDDWIHKQIRLFNSNAKLNREYMKSIKIVHIFINSLSEIVHSYKTIHNFDDTKSTIYSTDIYTYFKDNRTLELIKYDFNQLFVYNIEIDSTLYSNIDSINTINFLKGYTHMRDVVINPSLFIFHEVNSVYIIYKQHQKIINNKTLKNKKSHN